VDKYNHSFGPYAGKDNLGRKLPLPEKTGVLRTNRYVGMFYFINLSWNDGKPLDDNTKIWNETPEAFKNTKHPVWNTDGCYWGEPLFGYYAHNDEWVIRRHAMMLTMAGVDFILFDVTNLTMHAENALTVMKIFNDFYQSGWDVPKVAFYTNSEPGKRVQEIYETVYKKEMYPDIWFRWENKPFIIGRPEYCSNETCEYFTFRFSQWPTEVTKTRKGFPWMSFERPQLVFFNDKDENEVMSVSVAQHPQLKFGDSAFYGDQQNRGRSFHRSFYVEKNDLSPAAVNWGYNFAEQWEHAIECDSKIVFVTGWNEWAAGPCLRPDCKDRPVTFVDTASQEFSRDIEPMRDGHFDNYYLQLIDYICRYKGSTPWPQQSEQKTINISGDFQQWDGIMPEFQGFPFFEIPRKHTGMKGQEYIDQSGRNVFDIMKIAHDEENLYCYARCFNNITTYNFTPWMLLFIKVVQEGGDPADHPSWEGYHYLLNHEFLDGENSFLYESLGGWRWKPVANVQFRCSGKEFHAAVPLTVLGLSGVKKFDIEFKWADNIKETESVEDFYLSGCSSPYGRPNFIYRVE
jgi:hypothetical protein